MRSFLRMSYLSYVSAFGIMDRSTFIVIRVLNPIITMIFFILLKRLQPQSLDTLVLITSNALLMSSYSIVFYLGSMLDVERAAGTLKLLIPAPINKFHLLFAKSLFYFVDTLIIVFICFFAGTLLFDLQLNVNLLINIFTILTISCFSAFGFGLFLSSLNIVVRDLLFLLNTIWMMIILLSGVIIPVTEFPVALQLIGKILPISNAIEAIKLLNIPNSSYDIMFALIRESLVGITYILICVFILRHFAKLAQKDGNIDYF